MTKLSNAQIKVLNGAKERIDFARTHDFYDWYMRTASNFEQKNIHSNDELEKYLSNKYGRDLRGVYKKNYMDNINGIDYLCHASSKTIAKLESLGLIEIIKDSNGEYYGLDVIRILNY